MAQLAREQVVYRPLEETDFDAVASLYERLWCSGLDELVAPRASRLAAATYLAISPLGLVASIGNRVLGVVLARDGFERRVARWEGIRDELAGEARRLGLAEELESSLSVDRSELSLATGYSREGERFSQAQMTLLAVSPDAHGLGIGSGLFDRMSSMIALTGASGFFLTTDDECDWGYYEYRGLSRISAHEVDGADGSPLTVYLYGKELG